MLQLSAVVALDHSKFGSGLSAISKLTSNVAGAMSMAFGGVTGEIFTMTRAFGPLGGAIATLKQAITVGSGFEQQMANVASVSGLVGGELDKVSEAARDMAKTTRFTATQASEALYALASAGVSGADALADTLRPSLLLAGATLSDTTLATETITAALAAFQIPASEATRVADQFAGAVARSPANMQRLADAMKYAGPAAAGFGVSLEKTVAEIAAFHQVGLRGEQAGTAFRQGLIQLSKAAEGSNKAFVDALTGWDASTEGLTGAVRRLSDAGIDTADVISELGARAGPGIAAMMKVGAEAMDELAVNISKSADVAKMYETQMNTLSGQFAVFKSAAEEVFQLLFTQIAPAFTAVTQRATGLINTLIDLMKLMFSGEWGKIKDFISDAFVVGLNAAENGMNKIRKIISALPQQIERVFGFIENILSKIDWAQIGRDVYDAITDAIGTITRVLAEYVSGDSFQNIFKRAGEIAGSLLRSAFLLLGGFFREGVDGIADQENYFGATLWKIVTGVFNAIKTFVVETLEGLFGKNTIDRVVTSVYIFMLEIKEAMQRKTGEIIKVFHSMIAEMIFMTTEGAAKVASAFELKGMAERIRQHGKEMADGFLSGTNTMIEAADRTSAQIEGLQKHFNELSAPVDSSSDSMYDLASSNAAAEKTASELAAEGKRLEDALKSIEPNMEKVGEGSKDMAAAMPTAINAMEDLAEQSGKTEDSTAKLFNEFGKLSDWDTAKFISNMKRMSSGLQEVDVPDIDLPDFSKFVIPKMSDWDTAKFISNMKRMSSGLQEVDVPDIDLPDFSKFVIPEITDQSISRFTSGLLRLSMITVPDLSALSKMGDILRDIRLPDFTSANVSKFLSAIGELRDGLVKLDFGALGKMDVNIEGSIVSKKLDDIYTLIAGAKGIIWA